MRHHSRQVREDDSEFILLSPCNDATFADVGSNKESDFVEHPSERISVARVPNAVHILEEQVGEAQG